MGVLRLLGLVAFALSLGVALVVYRGYPWLTGDQGVFLSVAARMLDGDQLYTEVIDNKDPLFFYTFAAALWTGGPRAPFALDGLWFAVAAVSICLLLREVRAPSPAIVAAFLLYPLTLASGWYRPGLSMLAGLAIAPLASWLWLRGRPAAAGAVLGVIVLFKVNLALVAVAPIPAFLVLRAPEGRPSRQIFRAGLGLSAVLGIAALLLAAAGALGSYIDVLFYNVHYSNSLTRGGGLDGIQSHIRVVREYFVSAGRWQAPAAVAAVGAFVVAAYLGRRRDGRNIDLLSAAAACTLVATLGTLALTAIWGHHLQMLAFPIALGAATIVSVATDRYRQWAGIAAATACVLFASWSLVRSEADWGAPARNWLRPPSSVSADQLERARMRFYRDADRVTYMVFGSNSENAHAVFIDDAFDLTCRWFHLYAFSLDEQFVETLDCAESERPMLILVTLGFFEAEDAGGSWGHFVADARRLLESRYELVSEAHPGFQVWKRAEWTAVRR